MNPHKFDITHGKAEEARENAGAVEAIGAFSSDAQLRALHELQVHQLELEAQNEELQGLRMELENARAYYADLYETAPVAYLTLDNDARITGINRTGCALLGADRDELLLSPFFQYVDQGSLDILHGWRQAMLAGGESHSCDLRIIRGDGTRFWARLECRAVKDGNGRHGCRAVISDVSEHHRSREALEASEAYAKSLIGSMQDGFSVLDLKGVALGVNPAFCRMTGFSEEELLGKGPPHPYWPPEDRPRIQAALESLTDGSDLNLNLELTFMRRDGERFPVIVGAFAVPDASGRPVGFAATVKDITERRQMEQSLRQWNQRLEFRVAERAAALEQSSNRFRLLTEATFEGVAISENGILIDGNQQLAAMYHADLGEMIGRRVIDFVAPESLARVISRIGHNDETPYEYIGMRADGSEFPIEAHGRLMAWQGKSARVTALRDLTERKAAERQLESQRVELEQAMRLAILGEISSGIVHQLGQPLSAVAANLVAGMAEHADCGTKSCGIVGILRDIESDLARMRDCMNRLRALANPEQAVRPAIDLNSLVEKCLRILQPEVEGRGICVSFAKSGAAPWILADEVQLSQVLFNLVRNSLDASRNCPPERRKLEIKTRRVEGAGVELSVCDAGVGIAPEAKDRIFMPFFTTKPDGLGIGLRLSRTIVEAHGGSLEASNNGNGFGATFRVLLPLSPNGVIPKNSS